jgi:tRNA threonylcarbamoyladenosine dehydratase
MDALDLRSHRAQLVYAALAASAATASAITAYNAYAKSKRRQELAEEVARSITQRPAKLTADDFGYDPIRASRGKETAIEGLDGGKSPDEALGYEEELIREQLARNYAFFGDEAMSKVRGGSVVVVGCGGVGSWAAVMLARSYVIHSLCMHDFMKLSLLL